MTRLLTSLICALALLPMAYAGTPTPEAESVLHCISTRASVRQYTSVEVADATVDTLLRAAMSARHSLMRVVS